MRQRAPVVIRRTVGNLTGSVRPAVGWVARFPTAEAKDGTLSPYGRKRSREFSTVV